MQRLNGKGKLWGGEAESLEGLALGRLGGKSRYAGTGPGAGAAKGRFSRPLSYVSFGIS